MCEDSAVAFQRLDPRAVAVGEGSQRSSGGARDAVEQSHGGARLLPLLVKELRSEKDIERLISIALYNILYIILDDIDVRLLEVEFTST